MYSSTTEINLISLANPVELINPGDPAALSKFAHFLGKLIGEVKKEFSAPQIIILCIGSDRSTGDSLGPLVGSMLEELHPLNATVMGTLSRPVHALNLAETRALISEKYSSLPILAVDAGLGQIHKIGCLEVGKGSLKPGAAVRKKLPPIGHLFITGIVNVGGLMEMMVLQTTRLGVVLPLARFISWGIYLAASLAEWERSTN